MSRLLDQVDAYLSRAQRADAFEVARRATEIERERDRADELHEMARGNILLKLPRKHPLRRRMRSLLGAPAPGKFFWRVLDYEALPIERLKPYLDPRAIEAAIAVAISMGLRDLGGVQIEQDIGGYDERSESRRRSPAAAGRAPADDRRGRAPFHVAYDRRADLGGFTRGQSR